jgi:hypothetical protein
MFTKTTEDGYETYKWALSLSLKPEISVTATSATEKFLSAIIHACQGIRDLLLEEDDINQKAITRSEKWP